MVATVPKHNASALTTDRVIEILAGHLSAEIDAEFGRGTDDLTNDGIYLPDAQAYRRQPAPSREDMLELDDLVVYAGQRADPSYGDQENVATSGRIVEADVPWAASFVFARDLTRTPASDPVQARKLDDKEVLDRRAQKYRDIIAHTMTKYGSQGSGGHVRANAVQNVELDGDFSTTVTVSRGETTQRRGVGFVEFTISQFQLLPPHSQT